MYRTHTCGELRAAHIGGRAVLSGWVHRRREHGGLVFVDLRDRYGITQVVFDRGISEQAFAAGVRLGSEDVVRVEGQVAARIEGQANPDMATGEIELRADDVRVLNAAETTPFEVARDDLNIDEVRRLRYRYLDLRRARMRRNLELRHDVLRRIRGFLEARGFLEVETPILARSTPEGARDFLVPSRLAPGAFYALPQSPQQMKQILMVAGVDRYYQMARCFRDEDLRADRQLEFTQLDIEMSFVEQEDVIALTEALLLDLVGAVTPERPVRETPFPRMTYADAMARYGTDKPDLRFGLEIVDLGDVLADTEFRVFSGTLAAGGRVRAIAVPAVFSRREMGELEEVATRFGAKGLAWLAFEEGGVRGPIAKFLSEEDVAGIRARTGVEEGGSVMIVAADERVASESLGRLRMELGARLELVDESELAFLWVIDPPVVDWNEDEERWDAVHHPFTSPRPEDLPLMDSDPGAVRAQAYDIVLNGYELGGGSIRIHDADLQRRLFALLGIDEAQARAEFGHMLEAFRYGAPPHGGIAWGLDRVVMLLAGEDTIREVIPFPKTLTGADPMTDAPAAVPEGSLEALGIELRSPAQSQ